MNRNLVSVSAVACAALVAAVAGQAAAEEVWAVDSTSDSLYVFDTETGEVVRTVGRLHSDPARYQTPISMAVRPSDGAIFVKNNTPAIDDGLVRVDPATGEATFIGGGDLDGSIAFDDEGVLYGTVLSLGMVTVDPATGEYTVLAAISLPRLYGMDYRSADDRLYGIAWSFGSEPELYRINPDTGNVEDIIALTGGVTDAAPGSLVFESDGTLKATSFDGRLYTIDPVTGVVSDLIQADAGPQGMGLIVGGECYPDCDGSGDLDFFDFLCFQNEFATGAAYADCDDNGELDFFDFLCFQSEFAAGCP